MHLFSEKTVLEMASQRRAPPTSKQEAPRDAASRAHFSNEKQQARAQNVARICFHGCLLLQIARRENAVCTGFNCNRSNKLLAENEKDQCHEHISWDLTRAWPMPGDFQ